MSSPRDSEGALVFKLFDETNYGRLKDEHMLPFCMTIEKTSASDASH